MPNRNLILMRHAKSAWSDKALASVAATNDWARPLNERGRRDAPLMAKALLERQPVPDYVVCSDARRAVETYTFLAQHWPERPRASLLPYLYHATAGQIIEVISALPPRYERVLVVGHNPGLEQAASELARMPITMTTANQVYLRSGGPSWSVAVDSGFEWEATLRPKELAAAAEALGLGASQELNGGLR